MRKLNIVAAQVILVSALSLTGCLSQSTKDDLANLGREVGQKVAQGLKDEGKKIAEDAKASAFEGAKAGTAAIIQRDPDLDPKQKSDLLAQLAGAGGFAGIGGVLFAMAKAKAAAKAKQALGIVVNAAEDLPGDALATLKQGVKSSGGTHPAISSLIAEVKA